MVWCLVTPVSAVEARSSLVPTEAFLAPVDHQSAPRNHQRSLFLLVLLDLTHPVTSRSTQTFCGNNFEKRLQGGWKKGVLTGCNWIDGEILSQVCSQVREGGGGTSVTEAINNTLLVVPVHCYMHVVTLQCNAVQ